MKCRRKRKTYFISVTVLILLFRISQAQEKISYFPVLRGPYLGQKTAGTTPELFAPGIISKGENEILAVFTADGREFFYTTPGSSGQLTVMMSKQKDGIWTEPVVASFSGKHYDCTAGTSPDENRLYFVSMRPQKPGEKPSQIQNIWYVEKWGDRWENPTMMPEPGNSGSRDLGASLTNDGTIYFNTTRETVRGGGCRAKFITGKYSEPENIQDLVHTDMPIFEIAIDREAQYMVFVSIGQKDGFGGLDLYVSFNKGDDNWTVPVNMGERINTSADENFTTLSPDGNYLFFTSNRKFEKFEKKENLTADEIKLMENSPQNGKSDIYWVSTEILEDLKSEMLK